MRVVGYEQESFGGVVERWRAEPTIATATDMLLRLEKECAALSTKLKIKEKKLETMQGGGRTRSENAAAALRNRRSDMLALCEDVQAAYTHELCPTGHVTIRPGWNRLQAIVPTSARGAEASAQEVSAEAFLGLEKVAEARDIINGTFSFYLSTTDASVLWLPGMPRPVIAHAICIKQVQQYLWIGI